MQPNGDRIRTGPEAAHESLLALLRLSERLDLLAAGEAPARLSSTPAFAHRTTRPYLAPFEAAVSSRNFTAARRILGTAVASLSKVIARQLAAQRTRLTVSKQLKSRARAVCAFCGARGPAAVGSHVAICRSCAINAAELLTGVSRANTSRKHRSRPTTRCS
jgi:hypothetical protein